MIPEPVRIAVLLLAGLLLTAAAIMWASGCGASLSTHAARVQGAVTVLAEVVDPAYELAVDGCIARERLEVAAERDGGQAPQTTDQNLAQIRARCDQVVSAFKQMRGFLAGAEAALDEGNLAEAEKSLEKVRTLWGQLKP